VPTDLKYFVSYAHADKAAAHKLLDLLHPRLAILRGYSLSHWIDDAIEVGERWTDTIEDALAACDFGLLLLSPAFFASGFIRREELPTFIGQTQGPTGQARTRVRKPLVPVMLKHVPLDGSADLAGLEQLQVFRDRDGRSFDRTRGHLGDAFADQLTRAIATKLARLHPATSP
jgi:hypothetical protein